MKTRTLDTRKSRLVTLLHPAALLTVAVLLCVGCRDEERLRRAEEARHSWSYTAPAGIAVLLVLSLVLACNAFEALTDSSGEDDDAAPGEDPGRGDGPGPKQEPPGPSRPQLEDREGSPSTGTPGNNGIYDLSAKATDEATNATHRSTTIGPFPPSSLRAWRAQYFVLDGLNICRSYHPRGEFRLQTLLCLATEIIRRGATFECHFDANAKYRAAEYGAEHQRGEYEAIVRRHSEIFLEVPAGESADNTVLLRANSIGCPVISNDRFAKPDDGHQDLYPWLKSPGRRIPGKTFQNRLLVSALGIDVPIEPDLSKAIEAFEFSCARSRASAVGEKQLADGTTLIPFAPCPV